MPTLMRWFWWIMSRMHARTSMYPNVFFSPFFWSKTAIAMRKYFTSFFCGIFNFFAVSIALEIRSSTLRCCVRCALVRFNHCYFSSMSFSKRVPLVRNLTSADKIIWLTIIVVIIVHHSTHLTSDCRLYFSLFFYFKMYLLIADSVSANVCVPSGLHAVTVFSA